MCTGGFLGWEHTASILSYLFSSLQSSEKVLKCVIQSDALVCGLPGGDCYPLASSWGSIANDIQTPREDLTRLLSQIPSQWLITWSWNQNSWVSQLERRHTDVAGWSWRGLWGPHLCSQPRMLQWATEGGVFPSLQTRCGWGCRLCPGLSHPSTHVCLQAESATAPPLMQLREVLLLWGILDPPANPSGEGMREGALARTYRPPRCLGWRHLRLEKLKEEGEVSGNDLKDLKHRHQFILVDYTPEKVWNIYM